MTVRARRNCNPGNIVAGDHWQGLMPRDQMTPEQLAEPRFAVFAADKWGFRAMGIILLNYVRLHHLTTVNQIIGRWAPPNENDTDAYAVHVSQLVHIGINTPADFTKPDLLAALTKAISIHECGDWLFQDADLKAGIALAEAA